MIRNIVLFRKGRGSSVKAGQQLLSGLLIMLVLSICAGCTHPEPAPVSQPDQVAMDKGTIRIACAERNESQAVAGLWQVLLEKQGYEVMTIRADVPDIYTGLSAGDIDIFFAAWLPKTDGEYRQAHLSEIEDIGVWFSPVKFGLAVPRSLGIADMNDILGNKAQFDRTGDGSGDIIVSCENTLMIEMVKNAIERYGLDMTLRELTEDEVLSEAGDAFRNDEPVMVAACQPHRIWSVYDMEYLNDPEGVFDSFEEIHILGRRGFGEDFPLISAWLKEFMMFNREIAALQSYSTLDEYALSPVEAAEKWLEENPEKEGEYLIEKRYPKVAD